MACFWLLLQELHAKQLLTFALWAVLLYKLFEVWFKAVGIVD